MRSDGALIYYPKVFEELGDPNPQFTILALIKHHTGHEPWSLVSKSCVLKISPPGPLPLDFCSTTTAATTSHTCWIEKDIIQTDRQQIKSWGPLRSSPVETEPICSSFIYQYFVLLVITQSTGVGQKKDWLLFCGYLFFQTGGQFLYFHDMARLQYKDHCSVLNSCVNSKLI